MQTSSGDSSSTPTEPLIEAGDAEAGRSARLNFPHISSSNFDSTELSTRSSATQASTSSFFSTRNSSPPTATLSPRLKSLVSSYSTSSIAQAIRNEINDVATTSSTMNGNGSANEENGLQSYERASWWTQFKILSGRSFKNLYRNPMLMLSHYIVSILVACESCFLCFLIESCTLTF